MIEPKGEWRRFETQSELMAYLKENKLLNRTATEPKPLIYTGAYTDKPAACSVVGVTPQGNTVIEVNGELHCIHPAYLVELQQKRTQAAAEPSMEPSPDTDQTKDSPAITALTPENAAESFVVIDTETTGKNPYQDNIIEVAALRYEGRQETARFSTLVCPSCSISRAAQDVNQISFDMVAEEPPFADIAPGLLAFLGDSILLGHNITFDLLFLNSSLRRAGFAEIRNPSIDTLQLARKVNPYCTSYKLLDLVERYGVETAPTHRAEDDCRATAQLFFRLCELISANGLSVDVKAPPELKDVPGRAYETVKISAIKPQAQSFDLTHPCCGKSFVFTGEMQMPRQDAMQAVVNLGGAVKTSVSVKTDYLVVGQSESVTGKQTKAEQLNKSGKGHITILDEAAFLALLAQQGDGEIVEVKPAGEKVLLSEEELYSRILPYISTSLSGSGVSPEQVSLVKMKGYSTVLLFGKYLVCRVKATKAQTHISFKRLPLAQAALMEGVETTSTQSDEKAGFVRVSLTENVMPRLEPILSAITKNTLDGIPKAFDCCSRYEECSDAKHCVHPDADFAMGCGYSRILREGRIFYGKNRNID